MIVGIDLGTTHSLIGAYGADGALIPLSWDPPAFVPPGQMRKSGPWRMYR